MNHIWYIRTIYGKYNNKEPKMMTTDSAGDGRSEVRELNRLYLVFLQARLMGHGDPLGLPKPVSAHLPDMPEDLIGRLAGYPQAMFRFNFETFERPQIRESVDRADAALAEMQLILLANARNLSRQNPYAARVFLRVSAIQVRLLAQLAITELSTLAGQRDLVRCAYVRLTWMWTELFASSAPERSRLLILLGLQPSVEFNSRLMFSR